MARRHVNVLWVPEGGDQVRQFRVAVWPLYALASLAALLLIFLVGAGIVYFNMAQAQAENRILQAENEALRGELVTLGGETDRLDHAVRSGIHLANEARLLAGLAPYSEEVALQGVGGTRVGEAREANSGLTPGVRRTVVAYRDRLEQLSRQLAFQEESFIAVKQVVVESRQRLDRVPTINPVSGPYFLSSGFGSRRDPFTGRPSWHTGVDLRAPLGTAFRASADGRVVFAGYDGDFGLAIHVDHGDGLVTVYAHASDTAVHVGDEVHRGDVIGHIGHSGRTTGNHLHYEVRKNGSPANPRQYILQGEHFLD
jgi:murein DD-endopeptidase MepM/ murein hydrolase activator NlpD